MSSGVAVSSLLAFSGVALVGYMVGSKYSARDQPPPSSNHENKLEKEGEKVITIKQNVNL